jgi:hypothetical protein
MVELRYSNAFSAFNKVFFAPAESLLNKSGDLGLCSPSQA